VNLHTATRGIVQSINPDIMATIERSAGYDTLPSGKRKPKFLAAQSVMIQVQPMTTGDIRHAEFLNLQGVMRVVYGYGSTEGIVRATQKGGDLLTFPPFPGQPVCTWLTSEALEVWNSGWSKVIAILQTGPV
jgi:hypothetical protein